MGQTIIWTSTIEEYGDSAMGIEPQVLRSPVSVEVSEAHRCTVVVQVGAASATWFYLDP
jgi:hypothetical protein